MISLSPVSHSANSYVQSVYCFSASQSYTSPVSQVMASVQPTTQSTVKSATQLFSKPISASLARASNLSWPFLQSIQLNVRSLLLHYWACTFCDFSPTAFSQNIIFETSGFFVFVFPLFFTNIREITGEKNSYFFPEVCRLMYPPCLSKWYQTFLSFVFLFLKGESREVSDFPKPNRHFFLRVSNMMVCRQKRFTGCAFFSSWSRSLFCSFFTAKALCLWTFWPSKASTHERNGC